MWQAIQNITDYKGRRAPITREATFEDEPNVFYARFDRLNRESAVESSLESRDWPISKRM